MERKQKNAFGGMSRVNKHRSYKVNVSFYRVNFLQNPGSGVTKRVGSCHKRTVNKNKSQTNKNAHPPLCLRAATQLYEHHQKDVKTCKEHRQPFRNYKRRNAHHNPLNSLQFFILFCLCSERVRATSVQQSKMIGQKIYNRCEPSTE